MAVAAVEVGTREGLQRLWSSAGAGLVPAAQAENPHQQASAHLRLQKQKKKVTLVPQFLQAL